MSTLNFTVSTLENPSQVSKAQKPNGLTESAECLVEIPAVLLQRAIQACDTKTELVVYLTLLRYSLGFNRSQCSVSRRFIAAWTGLQYQNVGRGIEGLVAKGMIEKLPASNTKHGDVFKVVHVSEAFAAENGPMTRNQNDYSQPSQRNQIDYAQAPTCNQSDYTRAPACNHLENTPGVIKVITERNQPDDGAASNRLRSVINPITKNKKEEEEEERSSSSNSGELQKYVRSLAEPHLQKIERRCLRTLLQAYRPEQVELALQHIQQQGTAGGKKINLPLCYLGTGTSMKAILETAEKKLHEAQAKAHNATLAQERQRHEEAKQRWSEEAERQATQAFQRAFPDETAQHRVVAKIIEAQFPRMKPRGKTARTLAIHHWHKSLHNSAESFTSEAGAK